MKETITLSTREVQWMQVLEQVMRGALTMKAGTGLIGVCYRQAKRLLARYQREGPEGRLIDSGGSRPDIMLGRRSQNCRWEVRRTFGS